MIAAGIRTDAQADVARVAGVDPWEVEIGLEVEARVERLAEDPEDAQPVVVFYPASKGDGAK